MEDVVTTTETGENPASFASLSVRPVLDAAISNTFVLN